MNVDIGATAISSLGDDSDSLSYRGYAIEDLAAGSGFEEVAYLLLRGRLPGRPELDTYKARLWGLRALPPRLREVLELVPDEGSPMAVMDALRTACSVLGSLEPERSAADPLDAADRLIALFPGVALYWHRFVTGRARIEPAAQEET